VEASIVSYRVVVQLADGAHSGAFRQLSRRAGADSKWSALAVAVADGNGERTLNISANGQSSSLLPIAPRHVAACPDSHYVAAHDVRTTTLDALDAAMKAPPPFYAKLDIQGGELSALRGGAGFLKKTRVCEVELSLAELYDGGSRWQDVIDHPPGIGNEKLAGSAAVAVRDGMLVYARGMKAIDSGKLDEGARQAAALTKDIAPAIAEAVVATLRCVQTQ